MNNNNDNHNDSDSENDSDTNGDEEEEEEEEDSSDDDDYELDLDDIDSSDDDYGAKKRKKGTKRKTKPIYKFLYDHPQWKTHCIKVYSDDKAHVPCLVGGTLPRKDHGNTEDYYLTMLALFSPWRSGADLKAPNVSWEDAFASHSFSSRHQQIISFCNIKYECNDARHDFAAKRKKELAENPVHPIFGYNTYDLDTQNNEELVGTDLGIPDLVSHLESQWDEIGPQTANKMAQMVQIENVLEASGWMKPTDVGSVDPEALPEFIDGNSNSASGWKNVL
ncbi:hypothetical protein FA95DRAFT_1504927, partial [Auriscalpium vulgare]